MSLSRESVVSDVPSLSRLWGICLVNLDTLNNVSSLINMTFDFIELSHDPVVHSIKSTHVTLNSADPPHNAFKRTPERA